PSLRAPSQRLRRRSCRVSACSYLPPRACSLGRPFLRRPNAFSPKRSPQSTAEATLPRMSNDPHCRPRTRNAVGRLSDCSRMSTGLNRSTGRDLAAEGAEISLAADTSTLGDPHQLRKTGLTPTSALVKLRREEVAPSPFRSTRMRKVLRGYAKDKN